MSLPKFEIRAGRFLIDKETNKVKPQKAKGKIIVERNEEQETHFRWIDIDTKIEEMDMIVFAMDAKFEAVHGKNNTYVLKFQTDTDKYFFWMQEKVDPQEVVNKINEVINFQEDQEEPEPVVEEKPKQVQKMEPEKQQKPMPTAQKPLFNQDFIQRLTKNLQAAQKSQQQNITHLEKIFNYETIGKILNDLTEQDKSQLVEYLPEEQQKLQFFNKNVRSAQFSQALDALSEALNSQTALAIFAEMGLNHNHLKNHYGVHAFIKALIQWGNQQKK